MSTDPLLELLQELQRQSADIRGAVLATSEGFILAANGQLNDESAAATCVHIADVVEKHLSMLNPTHCQDLLIWSDHALWYILRIGNHVLMTTALSNGNAGAVRLITRSVGEKIAGVLARNAEVTFAAS